MIWLMTQRTLVSCIAEYGLSLFSLRAHFETSRICRPIHLTFFWITEKWDYQGVTKHIINEIIQTWLGNDIHNLIERLKVVHSLCLVTIARPQNTCRGPPGYHDWMCRPTRLVRHPGSLVQLSGYEASNKYQKKCREVWNYPTTLSWWVWVQRYFLWVSKIVMSIDNQ